MVPAPPSALAPQSAPRRLTFWPATLVLAIVIVMSGCSSSPDIDAEHPPGNPVMVDEPGDNPVLGSTGPGAVDEGSTNYVLLSVLALCLIAAGALLVKVERWERRRANRPEEV